MDGEALYYEERLAPIPYVETVRVRASHGLGRIFSGPNEAALVTLSSDWSTIHAVHSFIKVVPVTQ